MKTVFEGIGLTKNTTQSCGGQGEVWGMNYKTEQKSPEQMAHRMIHHQLLLTPLRCQGTLLDSLVLLLAVTRVKSNKAEE
jgi:hypothetical protein